jgi:hypothetical protein
VGLDKSTEPRRRARLLVLAGCPRLRLSALSLTTREGAPSFLRSGLLVLSFGGRVGLK